MMLPINGETVQTFNKIYEISSSSLSNLIHDIIKIDLSKTFRLVENLNS